MKQRKLVVGLLIMVAVAVSTFTFAYWQNSIANDGTGTASGTITIGEGSDVAVETSVIVDNETGAGTLVPVGYAVEGTSVDNLDLTFSVLWEGTALDVDGDTGELAVSVGTVKIDGNDVSGLFTISVASGNGDITAGTAQDVVVHVIFANEPANQAAYEAIANGSLVISFTFAVSSDMVA